MVELAPEAQLLDESAVALEVRPLEIVQEAPARVMVALVRSQVLRELVDPTRQHRDLDLRRAGVRVRAAVLLDDLLLFFLGEAHGPLSSCASAVPARRPRKKAGARSCGQAVG